MYLQPNSSSRPRAVNRYPLLTEIGCNVRAYEDAVLLPQVLQRGSEYLLVIPGEPQTILYASEDKAELDRIDFAIELIVGLVALVTGFKMGKDAYEVFQPMIDELYHTDEGFRDVLDEVGMQALTRDVLKTGKAVRDFWAYLWSHHRKELFRAIVKAVGRTFTPRRLLFLLLRWMIRLWSAGAALLMELGMLVVPLNRKLRGQ